MNTFFDRLLAALTVLNPRTTDEKRVKETAKQIIKNQNLSPYHENNLIAIIEKAQSPEQMTAEIIEYVKINN